MSWFSTEQGPATTATGEFSPMAMSPLGVETVTVLAWPWRNSRLTRLKGLLTRSTLSIHELVSRTWSGSRDWVSPTKPMTTLWVPTIFSAVRPICCISSEMRSTSTSGVPVFRTIIMASQPQKSRDLPSVVPSNFPLDVSNLTEILGCRAKSLDFLHPMKQKSHHKINRERSTLDTGD